jgi:hypothetical protein
VSDIFEITIDTSQLDLFANDLKMIPDFVREQGTQAMQQSVARGLEIVKEYPEQDDPHLHGNDPKPFYSPAQKRFVMAGIRTGTIIVPYPRTMEHQQTWQGSVESSPEVIQGHIGSSDARPDKPYDISTLLHGNGKNQAEMFRASGTWEQIDVLGEKVEKEVQPIFDSAIDKIIAKITGG